MCVRQEQKKSSLLLCDVELEKSDWEKDELRQFRWVTNLTLLSLSEVGEIDSDWLKKLIR
jgi:hypothetical protein